MLAQPLYWKELGYLRGHQWDINESWVRDPRSPAAENLGFLRQGGLLTHTIVQGPTLQTLPATLEIRSRSHALSDP